MNEGLKKFEVLLKTDTAFQEELSALNSAVRLMKRSENDLDSYDHQNMTRSRVFISGPVMAGISALMIETN